MKKTLLLLPLLGLLILTGCGSFLGMTAASGGIYASKHDAGPPADTASQIAPHENWCYSTMGHQVECFSEPQDTASTRLVNVDPQSRYPLTNKAYQRTLRESQDAEAQREALRNLPPGSTVTTTTVETVETKPLNLTPKKKVVVTKKTVVVKKPVKKKVIKHKKKVVHKKVAPKPATPAPQPDPVMPEDLPQPAIPN